MRGHRKNDPSELYTDRDHFSWLRRIVATISTWLALAGYTLFALIFTSEQDNLKTSKRVLTALASTFIILGYVGGVGAFFLSSNLSYRYDSVIYPFFLTSVGGLMEVVLNHSLHKEFPVGNIYIILPLVLASTTTVVFGFLSFTSLKRLDRMKRMQIRANQEVPQWETHSFAGNGDPGQATELLAMMPEDEAQRQQLLRLLIAREQGQRGPSPDPSSTYRIEWMEQDDHTHLAVPQPGRPRSGSAPSITNRWHIANLLGTKKQPSTEDIKSQREYRRREIERDSLTLTPGSFTGDRESATWGGGSPRDQ
jgi:hypothetical protein